MTDEDVSAGARVKTDAFDAFDAFEGVTKTPKVSKVSRVERFSREVTPSRFGLCRRLAPSINQNRRSTIK